MYDFWGTCDLCSRLVCMFFISSISHFYSFNNFLSTEVMNVNHKNDPKKPNLENLTPVFFFSPRLTSSSRKKTTDLGPRFFGGWKTGGYCGLPRVAQWIAGVPSGHRYWHGRADGPFWRLMEEVEYENMLTWAYIHEDGWGVKWTILFLDKKMERMSSMVVGIVLLQGVESLWCVFAFQFLSCLQLLCWFLLIIVCHQDR